MEILINKLISAKTKEEIISYKSQILELYTELYNKICSQSYHRTHYDDIKMLYTLNDPMRAYYGSYFYDEYGIPFIKEHNPRTLDVLSFIILFYSLQIINLLENDFYNDISVCIYENKTDEILDHIERINLTEYKYNDNLFELLWFHLLQIITLKKDKITFSIYYGNESDVFYLSREEYEEIMDMIYKNYDKSFYSNVIDSILGIYEPRFTKIEYLLSYQPIFVTVGYNYLKTFLK